MKIKAAIFDLDGTLLDTLSALTWTTNLVMDHFGLRHIDAEHMRRFVGDGYRCQMERALRFAGDPELTHYEESLGVYTELFAEHCMHEVRPYEGIPELLSGLRAQGIRLAVFSNKPHARTVQNIEGIFGKGSFDVIRGEQPGVPKKPDPAGVRLILAELDALPEETLYIGDTNTDMETGLGAGLVTVGAAWGFRGRGELEAFHPQAVIDRPEELLNMIRQSGEKRR